MKTALFRTWTRIVESLFTITVTPQALVSICIFMVTYIYLYPATEELII